MNCRTNASGRGGWALLLGLAVLLLGAGRGRAAAEPRLLWTGESGVRLFQAATVADLNGDGLCEIVIVGERSILVYDGTGKRLWEYPISSSIFHTSPTVWVPQKAEAYVYAADMAGTLYCLDGKGKLRWQGKLPAGADWSEAPVADLNGDGQAEVLQTDDKGGISTFNARTGAAGWRAQVGAGLPVSPAVGRLGATGMQVVVVSNDGVISAFGGDGSKLWATAVGGDRSLNTSPVIFAAADGTGRVVTASPNGEVFCTDAAGAILWRRPVVGTLDASISVGDIDRDGRPDIFVITQSGVVYRLDQDGAVVWLLDMQTRSDACGDLLDMNGDGRLEYLLATHQGQLLAINSSGEVIWNHWLGVPNAYNATPAIGKVSKASPGLDMVVTGGTVGKVFCFSLPTPADALVQWGGYRGTPEMTGAWAGLAAQGGAGMVPVDLAWSKLLMGRPVTFAITRPAGAGPLTGEAVCISPQGMRHTVTARIQKDTARLSLPVSVLSPGAYRFAWSLTDQAGKVLVKGERELTMVPFANERQLADTTTKRLQAVAGQLQDLLPLTAAALTQEARLIGERSQALRPRQEECLYDTTQQPPVEEQTGALVARCLRATKLARVAAQAPGLGPGASLVAFTGPRWDSVGVGDLLPEGVAPFKLAARLVQGEHESVAINMLNITDRELRVRPVVEAPAGMTVVVRRAAPVPTNLGFDSWDALPELDATRQITIPSLGVSQLWLEIDTGSAAAGDHLLKVRLQAMNGAGVNESRARAALPPETAAEVAMHLLPFPMAPSSSLRLCTWSMVESNPRLATCVEAAYADLWAHGNNVFIVPWSSATYNAAGALTGPIDYSKLDVALQRWQGKDVVLLVNGYPDLHDEAGKDAFGSPTYQKALKPYLDDFVAHLAGFGVDLQHFALYPIDEASGWEQINATILYGKLMKAVNPKVQIYADPFGTPEMLKALAPYMDIWTPGINVMTDHPDVLQAMREDAGSLLWEYNCASNDKAVDVVTSFLSAPMFALRYDLTGIGFWTYCVSQEDNWTRSSDEYPIIYPSPAGPVTSRRWEALREGTDDYRIIVALRARAAEPGTPAAAKQKIEHLLRTTLPQYVDNGPNESAATALRAELMDCVEAVLAK